MHTGNKSNANAPGRLWFLLYADEFYMLTRFAYFAFLQNAAFINAHRAIEYYLKAGLVGNLSLRELKNMGHNLVQLWTRYKEVIKIDESFDEIINYMNRFDELRYPRFRLDSFTHVAWGLPLREFFQRFDTEDLQRRVACFDIDEFDRLIWNIRTTINPSINYMALEASEEQIKYLYRENKYFQRSEESKKQHG